MRKPLYILLVTVVGAFRLSLVTWSTMQYGDAYNAQWGTPSEIELASELAESRGIPLNEARDILSSWRFEREAERIRQWQNDEDVIALQEVEFTHDNAVRLIDKVELATPEWQAACPLPATNATSLFATPLMLRRKRFISIHPLSFGTKDIPGCIVLAVSREGQKFVFGSMHAESGAIRSDAGTTVGALQDHLDDVIGSHASESFIVLGGDWNAHVYDLLPIFQSRSRDWRVYSAGKNDTITPLSLPRFTTQHEHNWLAAYDAWFVRGAPNSVSRYHALTVELRDGFLPKNLYRGKDGLYGVSPFYFDGCRHGPGSGFPCRMKGLLHFETHGATWTFPRCSAKAGLSDHMAVQMDLSLEPLCESS